MGPLEDTFVSHCWASSYNELLVIMQRTLETRLGLVDELVEPHARAPYDLRAALKTPGGWFHPVHKGIYFVSGEFLCEPGKTVWLTRTNSHGSKVYGGLKAQGFHPAHLSLKNWLRKNGK